MISESGFNLVGYAERVAEMSDAALLAEGKEIRKLVYPRRVSATGPSSFELRLEICRKEWRRRHPKTAVLLSSQCPGDWDSSSKQVLSSSTASMKEEVSRFAKVYGWDSGTLMGVAAGKEPTNSTASRAKLMARPATSFAGRTFFPISDACGALLYSFTALLPTRSVGQRCVVPDFAANRATGDWNALFFHGGDSSSNQSR
jgi:hypothetical protein